MNVIITGIKSRKTLNTIMKDLSWPDVKGSGGPGNFQVTVLGVAKDPAKSLEWIIGELRNLTPEHISNLKWTVKK